MERRRLLYGDWEAREANSTYFMRNWCEEVTSYDPTEFTKVVRAWDMATTLKSDHNPSPDYTVGTLMGKTKSGDYVVLDVRRMRVRSGEWERVIAEAWESDRRDFRDVMTLVTQDPGAAGEMACNLLRRALAERGIVTEKIRPSGKKLDRFRPFSACAYQGSIKFVKGCGNDFENGIRNDNVFIYKELEAFDGERRRGEHGHDRVCCRV